MSDVIIQVEPAFPEKRKPVFVQVEDRVLKLVIHKGPGGGVCVCDTTTPPPDSGVVCTSPGAVVLQCGCWGYAVMGQVVPATRCCSGYAIHEACDPVYYGYCAGGGVLWGNRCQ